MAAITTLGEPTQNKRGDLVHLTWTVDVNDGTTATDTTTKSYQGYFLGAHLVVGAGGLDAGAAITVKYNGVDVFGGLNPVTTGYYPAFGTHSATDLALEVPIDGTLAFAVASAVNDDDFVFHAFIRIAGT